MITTNALIHPAPSAMEPARHVPLEAGASSPVTELLTALRTLHPNILIVGSDVDAERTFEYIRPTLLTPIASWRPTDMPHLPSPTFRTLIVRDADLLTATQQASLARLL